MIDVYWASGSCKSWCVLLALIVKRVPFASKVLAPLDPSRFPSKVAPEKTAVIAAMGDGITTPDQALALQKHFGGSIDWLVAGHLTAFKEAKPAIERIAREHLGAALPTKRVRRLI